MMTWRQALAAGGGLLLLNFVVPYPSTGVIEAREWSRTATILTFESTEAQGWKEKDQLTERFHRDPDEAGEHEEAGVENIRDCVHRVRTFRQVPSGTRVICSSLVPEIRAGGGHGFSGSHGVSGGGHSTYHSSPHTPHCHSSTTYTSVPVYDDQCTYDTWKWVPLMAKRAQGTADSPYTPELERPLHDRILVESVYRVSIQGKMFDVEESDFLPVGESVAVWKSQAFGVIALRRVSR